MEKKELFKDIWASPYLPCFVSQSNSPVHIFPRIGKQILKMAEQDCGGAELAVLCSISCLSPPPHPPRHSTALSSDLHGWMRLQRVGGGSILLHQLVMEQNTAPSCKLVQETCRGMRVSGTTQPYFSVKFP